MKLDGRLKAQDFPLTSVALPRFEQCPASGCFRWRGEKPSVHPSAWYGIFVHRFLERAANEGRESALRYIREKAAKSGSSAKAAAAVCARIDTDAIPPGAVEVALIHNVMTGGGWQGFGARPSDVGMDVETDQWGKADLFVGPEVRAVPLVADYKTGEGDSNLPRHSTQLCGLAAAARGMLRPAYEGPVDVAIVNVRKSGELRWKISRLQPDQLDAYEARARRAHLRVLQGRQRLRDGALPEFNPGKQCEKCELREGCPVHK